jgi:hypothetical protein
MASGPKWHWGAALSGEAAVERSFTVSSLGNGRNAECFN